MTAVEVSFTEVFSHALRGHTASRMLRKRSRQRGGNPSPSRIICGGAAAAPSTAPSSSHASSSSTHTPSSSTGVKASLKAASMVLSTTTTTFQPEARTKVVQYFDTYKTSPHGLPPGLSERIVLRDVPAAWRTAPIPAGVVVAEKQRPLLIEAPPELVRVLPAPTPDLRYYVAGSNVIAVNKTYQVVDSIQIPTVKIVMEP